MSPLALPLMSSANALADVGRRRGVGPVLLAGRGGQQSDLVAGLERTFFSSSTSRSVYFAAVKSLPLYSLTPTSKAYFLPGRSGLGGGGGGRRQLADGKTNERHDHSPNSAGTLLLISSARAIVTGEGTPGRKLHPEARTLPRLAQGTYERANLPAGDACPTASPCWPTPWKRRTRPDVALLAHHARAAPRPRLSRRCRAGA